VGGCALEAGHHPALRARTAWVDPSAALWRGSLLSNLLYGSDESAVGRLGLALEAAELRPVLEELPEGLQSPLGEGGARLSGGQGQRVRLGRAFARQAPDLVLLDEAFRGLDRETRRCLLQRCRARWAGTTLLHISHDLQDADLFERVVVMEGGRVVEDGEPAKLMARTDSRYAALRRAEEQLHQQLWAAPLWRRWTMRAGRLLGGR
jgi:ATP-binding cassette subfamily B protein